MFRVSWLFTARKVQNSETGFEGKKRDFFVIKLDGTPRIYHLEFCTRLSQKYVSLRLFQRNMYCKFPLSRDDWSFITAFQRTHLWILSQPKSVCTPVLICNFKALIVRSVHSLQYSSSKLWCNASFTFVFSNFYSKVFRNKNCKNKIKITNNNVIYLTCSSSTKLLSFTTATIPVQEKDKGC